MQRIIDLCARWHNETVTQLKQSTATEREAETGCMWQMGKRMLVHALLVFLVSITLTVWCDSTYDICETDG